MSMFLQLFFENSDMLYNELMLLDRVMLVNPHGKVGIETGVEILLL
jgi:hypothetical protein